MGIFSNLLGRPSSIEKHLENLYVAMFQKMMGMSPSQAKRASRDLLEQAKQESLKEGTPNLPKDFGEILLEMGSTDEKTKLMLAKKRKKGVRDEDIRWWWNLHDLERRMMLKFDERSRFALYMKLREEDGLNEEEAAKRVRESHPFFGDPDDTSHATGQDRPLPYELKDRINIHVEKRVQIAPENFKKDVEESSSVNALIRKEMAKGNL